MDSNTKVCMLTSRHFHDDARIYHKEAKTLVDSGFAVTIIAPYRGREVTDRSIPIRIFHKTRYFRKLGTLTQLVKLGFTEKADIYHVHEGDSSFLAGVLIKLLNGIKRKKVFLIYDSHEFWAFLFQDKAPKYLRKVVKWGFILYEGLLITFCDAIITANDIVEAYFRFMDFRKPLVRLYNVPILSLFAKNEVPLGRKRCTFCHEGRIIMNRGIVPLLNALVVLRQRRTDWRFVFIGEAFDTEERDFLDRIFHEHPDLKEYVEITGWLTYEEVGNRLELCDVGC
ncbi:MAG: glycosyltransferase family 4 protein, partial [Bacteroidetes bacterium]|nr:glycosyltransferase family 4 protein [Bacteroidota bacterium]